MPLSDPKNTDKTNSNATNQTQNMVDNDQTREVVVEEMEEMMEDDENRDQDESEDVKMKLDIVLFKLQSVLSDRIEHDPKGYKKSLSTFDKPLERMPTLNDAALQKALCISLVKNHLHQ